MKSVLLLIYFYFGVSCGKKNVEDTPFQSVIDDFSGFDSLSNARILSLTEFQRQYLSVLRSSFHIQAASVAIL